MYSTCLRPWRIFRDILSQLFLSCTNALVESVHAVSRRPIPHRDGIFANCRGWTCVGRPLADAIVNVERTWHRESVVHEGYRVAHRVLHRANISHIGRFMVRGVMHLQKLIWRHNGHRRSVMYWKCNTLDCIAAWSLQRTELSSLNFAVHILQLMWLVFTPFFVMAVENV